MRRLEKTVLYLALFLALLVAVFVSNIIVIAVIGVRTDNSRAYVRVGEIAEHLMQNAQGFEMDEAGIALIDSYEGFAMVVGNDGAVQWEYRLPEELPREYTLSQVAVFSRYYLMDYPVYTQARAGEDGVDCGRVA